MVKAVVTPSNLGTEFDVGVIEAGKVRLKLGANLTKNAVTGAIDAATGAGGGAATTFVTPSWTAPRADLYNDFNSRFEPIGNSATSQSVGSLFSALGTATARATTGVAAGSAQSRRRLGIVSAATAGSFAGGYGASLWLTPGNGAVGGFLYVARISVSDAALQTVARSFVGFQSNVAAPTNVAPGTLFNTLAFVHEAGATNWSVQTSTASAVTTVALSNSFPIDVVTSLKIALYMPRNQSAAGFGAGWYIKNEMNGAEASGVFTAAQVPAAATMLAWRAWRTNNTAAAAVGLDLQPHIIDTYA